MSSKPILGFIGVGVMGMGMCRNLAQKSGCTVLAADLNADNVRALAGDGVIASSVRQIAETARCRPSSMSRRSATVRTDWWPTPVRSRPLST